MWISKAPWIFGRGRSGPESFHKSEINICTCSLCVILLPSYVFFPEAKGFNLKTEMFRQGTTALYPSPKFAQLVSYEIGNRYYSFDFKWALRFGNRNLLEQLREEVFFCCCADLFCLKKLSTVSEEFARSFLKPGPNLTSANLHQSLWPPREQDSALQ